MKTKKLFIALILGLGLTVGLVGLVGNGLTLVHAASFTVDVTNDENDGSCAPGDCSLREAIIAANGNGQADTITLGSGTYDLSIAGTGEDAGATGDLDITAPLTITGQGPDQTIIDANGIDRALGINLISPPGTVVISGVTIINGGASSGGGILNMDADVILVNTVISNNISSVYGGGMSVVGGSVTLNETQILSNTAVQRGGGVYVYAPSSGNTFFTQNNDSLIAYNHATQASAGSGGGVYLDGRSSGILSGGQIFSNTAEGDGGGLYVFQGTVTLNGGQILSNTAGQDGGGIFIDEGNATLSDGEIRGNQANVGGGVYVYDSTATFTQTGDSEIAYNKTAQTTTNGGGVYVNYGHATLSSGQIHHNTAGQGGGLFIFYGNATLNGGQILSNTANNDGGGVYVDNTTAAFTQTGASLIAYNTGTANGGGVYVRYGSAMLSGREILSNTVSNGNGGGVYVANGSATLNAGQIRGNQARYGGGVYVYNTTAAFTQTGVTTITHNTANTNGGGLYVVNGSATLSGGAICDNNASTGGGMYVAGNAQVNASQGQIVRNTAQFGGGGIYQNSGMLSLVNVTLSGNTSNINQGSGLYVGNGTAALTYTTVASNTTTGIHRAGGSVLLQDTIVAYNGAANCNTGLTSNGYNLDSGSTCGFGATGDQSNTDPLLGSLADNGGNTLTHALLDGSPAIDQGNCVAGITTDQRGIDRPQGTTCDIGAFEVEAGGAVYLPIIMRN